MLRIALIGCGHHGRHAVLPAIRNRAKRAQLVAVADVNPQNLAPIDNPPATYTDYRQMLEREKLDAVFVATLQDTHRQITLDALSAGLHVICEKPMAVTAQECRQMADAARAARRMLIIDFEVRMHPHMRAVRNWIDQGKLGQVEAVHLTRMWDGHKSTGPLAERRARLLTMAGGLDCGIHDVDLARYFAGGDWRTLHALGAWMGEPFDKPPHIGIIGRLDSGALVTVNASLAYGAHITPRPIVDTIQVVGRDGVVSVCIDADSAAAYRNNGQVVRLYARDHVEETPVVMADHVTAIADLVDAAAASIESGQPDPYLATGEDGYQAQLAVEMANQHAITERARPIKARMTKSE